MIEIFVPTLKQALMITAFVLFMMVVIDYINVQSRNLWAKRLQQSPILQIVVAAILGITPGCLGAFTVVSLYTHRMMGVAGLVAAMIAASGDEAFVMFALFPGKAFLLQFILLGIAILTGFAVDLWLIPESGPHLLFAKLFFHNICYLPVSLLPIQLFRTDMECSLCLQNREKIL